MNTIRIKDKTIMRPPFIKALASLKACNLPVPVMKNLRRISKKIDEEYKELKQDTLEIMNTVFKDRFKAPELKKLVSAQTENLEALYKSFNFSQEDRDDFENLLVEFNKKCEELGETDFEIPYPKIVLPENFEFRTDYATLLEDILDLD